MTTLETQADIDLALQIENHLVSVRSNSSKAPANGSSPKTQNQWLVVPETTSSIYGVPDLSSGVLSARNNSSIDQGMRHDRSPSHLEASSPLHDRLSSANNNTKDDDLNNGISIISEHNPGGDIEEDVMWNSTETTLLLNYIDQNYTNWFSGNKTKFYKQLIVDVLKNRNATQVKNKVHKLLAKYHKIKQQKSSGGQAANWIWYSRMDQVFGQRGHTSATNMSSDSMKNANCGGDSSDDTDENNKRPLKKKKRASTSGTSNNGPLPIQPHTNFQSGFTASSVDWLEKYLESRLAMQQRDMDMQIMLQKEKLQRDYDLQKEKLEVEKINAENVKLRLSVELEQIRLMRMQFEMKVKDLELKLQQVQRGPVTQ